MAGAICNTSEKGGEHTGRGRHLFDPWEVAWKKILRTEERGRERGDFPKWKQLIRRTTRDFHYKIRGRERERERANIWDSNSALACSGSAYDINKEPRH